MIVAGFLAADAAIAAWCDAPVLAIALLAMSGTTLALFWRVPLCDEDGNDIDTQVDAARAAIPDHVPAEWVKEHNQ